MEGRVLEGFAAAMSRSRKGRRKRRRLPPPHDGATYFIIQLAGGPRQSYSLSFERHLGFYDAFVGYLAVVVGGACFSDP